MQAATKYYKKSLEIAERNRREEYGSESFLIDDQLLGIVLKCCAEHHELATREPLSELSGTTYVYLWGMAALLVNAEASTPTYLSPEFVDTVVCCLADALMAVEATTDALKYAPYIQYYCMHILYRLSSNIGMRTVLRYPAASRVQLSLQSSTCTPPSNWFTRRLLHAHYVTTTHPCTCASA